MTDIVLTPEQIQERLLAQEGSFADDENVIIDGNNGGGDGTFTPSPLWDFYKTKLPDDQRESFKLPEDITKENETEVLDAHFKTLYSPQSDNNDDPLKDVHPLAKEIIEYAKDPNFNPNDWLSKKANVSSMVNASDDDLLVNKYMKELGKTEDNPNGMTREEIVAEVEKLNPLEKKVQAKKEREIIQEQVNKSMSYQADPAAMQKAVEEKNANVTKFADTYFSDKRQNPEKTRTIAGVELSEAEFQTFKNEFVQDFTIGKEGYAPIAKVLNDDNMLVKIAFFLKYEDKIAQTLTQKFNEGKNFVFDKLNLSNDGGSHSHGAGQSMTQEEINARLKAPEGSYQG